VIDKIFQRMRLKEKDNEKVAIETWKVIITQLFLFLQLTRFSVLNCSNFLIWLYTRVFFRVSFIFLSCGSIHNL
ncbi:hypothetical protein, partial [Klebsiella pneumoniae]|uniref:hypothetical protein n=1 Tax=Klebsiella pneumoniae TaxID=573 RepID=UPI0022B5E7DD